MANDITKAAGEPLTIELNDKIYTISPLTIGDYIALRSRIRGQRLSNFLANCSGIPSDEKVKIITSLSSQTITEEDLLEEATTTDGTMFMLWRMLIKKHPEMTLEEIQENMDEDTMTSLNALTSGVSEYSDEELKKAQTEEVETP